MAESLTILKIELSFSLKVFFYGSLAHTLHLKTEKPNVLYGPSMTSSVLYLSKPLFLLAFGQKPFAWPPIFLTSDQPKLVHFILPFNPSFSTILNIQNYVFLVAYVFQTSPPLLPTSLPLAPYLVFISDLRTITKALAVSTHLLDVFLFLDMLSSTKTLFLTPPYSHLQLPPPNLPHM
jgi:hypothetical protein